MLADIAAARPRPGPFFGELGSVNPTFMTAAALSEGAQQNADGFVVSVSGSAGQLRNKPGFLFVPFGHDLDGRLAAKVATVARTPAALPGIARSYRDRRDTILGAGCVTIISEGSLRFDEDEQGWVTPTIVRVSAKDLVEQGRYCSTRRSARCRYWSSMTATMTWLRWPASSSRATSPGRCMPPPARRARHCAL